MSENAAANPHDAFFKLVFSVKNNARDFLSGTLASDLKRKLDLHRLRQENHSFVTHELKEHFSDLIYTCPIRGGLMRIALLLEHKSYPEPFIHLQLMR